MSAAEKMQAPAVEPGRADDQNALAPSLSGSASPAHHAHDRIREAVAVLNAISAGELLADLPQSPIAQNRHETAVSLLSAMEVLLRDALVALED